MYNGIGLSTARGTGTNGYVTTNAAALPKTKRGPIQRHQDIKVDKIKQADPEILEHEKKRQIEIKVTKWADEQGLLDADMPREKLEQELAKARERFTIEFEREASDRNSSKRKKEDETHARLQAKEKQYKEMAGALGIDNEYQHGSAFDRELQQQKRMEKMRQRIEDEERKKRERREAEREERDRRRDDKKRRRDDSDEEDTRDKKRVRGEEDKPRERRDERRDERKDERRDERRDDRREDKREDRGRERRDRSESPRGRKRSPSRSSSSSSSSRSRSSSRSSRSSSRSSR
eukprot:TRINITY_DN13522_c0_g1_i1.p1 TRINITY_DN13522_c0_g1~~TRINITY_DN13522_c0_g1_i1.p1  ORF type:complete len:305 (-),score=91.38 TRINITY_DN13522_c0_g1_i1:32-904(-)